MKYKHTFLIDLCLILILSFCVMASAFPSDVMKSDCVACHQSAALDLEEVIPLSTVSLMNEIAITEKLNNLNTPMTKIESFTKAASRCMHGTHLVRVHIIDTVFKVPWPTFKSSYVL